SVEGYDVPSYRITQARNNRAGKTEITNKLVKGDVRLVKKDGYTGVTLAGAVFGLFTAGGVQVGSVKTSGNDGLITFSGLRYGTYYLEEIETPAGYTRRTDKYYFTIDAEHGVSEPVVLEAYNDPAMVAIDGAKVWDDQGDVDRLRPASIEVILYANGVEVAIQTVSANDLGYWTYDFGRMPKYDESGKEINYTVAETVVQYYDGVTEKLVDADGNISFVITNTHTPSTPPPTPVPPTPGDELPVRIRPGVLGVKKTPPAPTPTVNPSVLGARRAVKGAKRVKKVLGARRASTGDEATMVLWGSLSGTSFAGFWAWILAALKRKKAERARRAARRREEK
nr:Cna B-type domain-containing protein [Lachnospiraceae bacterium]